MPFNHEQQRTELSQKLIRLVQQKAPPEEARLIAEFIPYFLGSVDTNELEGRDIEDLLGTVLTQWSLVYQRAQGETKLRVLNPELTKDGWQSSHTIIALAHDDMPFLVDSLQMELNRRNITCHIVFHAGGINIQRDAAHRAIEIYPMGTQAKCQAEAVVYMEVDKQGDPAVIEDLYHSCQHILRDVELAVEDWRPISVKVAETITEIKKNPPPLDSKEISETMAFLQWLLDDNFIFMGYREYRLAVEQGEKVLVPVADTGLGVLRESSSKHSRAFSTMTPEAQQIALSAHLLIIAKSNIVSTVHRSANTDIIGVKMFNEKGEVIGEHRIIGLYTSVAYHSRPYSIPVLREKVREVMIKSKLVKANEDKPMGHAGKALLNILETLPRDDLFQTNVEELLQLATGILYMQDRREIRLFIRKDVYGRFLSCLVYVPKDRFDTELREKMEAILRDEFNAESITYNTLVSDSVLARIHYMVHIDPQQQPVIDIKAIEKKLVGAARSWQEDLMDEMLTFFGEQRLKDLAHYVRAFPAGYRENCNVRIAVRDIQQIESLVDDDSIAMNLGQAFDEQGKNLRFKLYRKNQPVSLSDALPMLENMGLSVLSEEPYRVNLPHNQSAWISEFSMVLRQSSLTDLDRVRDLFQDAFKHCWYRLVENDGFNRLVLAARLTWREIAILRAYAKYFKQIGFTFSQAYIEETLAKHAAISAHLVDLFTQRFDPNYQGEKTREQVLEEIEKSILLALDNVTNLNEDRILRRYLEIIKATLRTNYFQQTADGQVKSYISFKLDSQSITDLPLPRPMVEVWVSCPRVEAIHLRSSEVARGGLRWSDRPEDFRTEVLGLMKAQKVKNAVIVPSGAKGGFVPKMLIANATREEIFQEGVESYRIFIRGLLDITDNLIAGEIVPPKDVLRYDGDDPYLVVAADKGTATFSNFANEIAAEYGFWLDDAFASGGITGYDHKKMGITARGAWESTKRHFRELGLNTQTQDFTVVGIGDLAGDVFGNGVLQSEHIKLLAAFNHMHIFLDPNPDTVKSFAERERIFNLPRSSWEDYDVNLISKGGGVFKRSLKSIPLTAEIKSLFDLKQDQIEPNDLIRVIMKSKVDLLWNGGIGTFVKASDEMNEHVGDKTNDNIRINGSELNCRVVVEGGNLGFTQLGRVEFARKGGRIYTDFIDNSAGVDCSDHEVNIKILLNEIVIRGDMTLKKRNELLVKMTDEVAALVLRDNYMQTQALSIATQQATKNPDLFIRFMQGMIDNGKLDRDIEFLPDDKQLQERKSIGQSLTAPEMAVLLAYSKMQLKEDILLSDLPNDIYLIENIKTAFPSEIDKHFREAMLNHSLRREILATQLSNSIINYMGITFISRIVEETGAPIASIVRSYSIACAAFGARDLWRAIEELDYKVNPTLQYDMMQSVTRLLRRATRWFLRNHRNELLDIGTVAALYQQEIAGLYDTMPSLLSGAAKNYYNHFYKQYIEGKVPEKLAKQVAITITLFASLDIIAASNEHGFEPKQTAKVYFKLGAKLELGWLRANIINQVEENHWDALGKAALRDDIDLQHRELATAILTLAHDRNSADGAIQSWSHQHEALLERWQRVLLSLKSMNTVTFVMYAVAVRELFELMQASKQCVREA
ncbi:MAG: NAD-glutamate dehydrogenase [Gammaproteobacteria bacterium]|nr:NAD-glutamate dehydrogenase [Gammaproteobacteria bacterium]